MPLSGNGRLWLGARDDPSLRPDQGFVHDLSAAAMAAGGHCFSCRHCDDRDQSRIAGMELRRS